MVLVFGAGSFQAVHQASEQPGTGSTSVAGNYDVGRLAEVDLLLLGDALVVLRDSFRGRLVRHFRANDFPRLLCMLSGGWTLVCGVGGRRRGSYLKHVALVFGISHVLFVNACDIPLVRPV